jgi:hypothetical protein
MILIPFILIIVAYYLSIQSQYCINILLRRKLSVFISILMIISLLFILTTFIQQIL